MACSDLLCYSLVLKKNFLLLLNSACFVQDLGDLVVHFFESFQKLVLAVPEDRFFEPVPELVLAVLAVRFSEPVRESETEVLLAPHVPAFVLLGLEPVADESAPADAQLL